MDWFILIALIVLYGLTIWNERAKQVPWSFKPLPRSVLLKGGTSNGVYRDGKLVTFKKLPSWVWKLQLGRGAGYRWGRTFWVAWRAAPASLGDSMHGVGFGTLVRVGFTGDGNKTCYPQW